MIIEPFEDRFVTLLMVMDDELLIRVAHRLRRVGHTELAEIIEHEGWMRKHVGPRGTNTASQDDLDN